MNKILIVNEGVTFDVNDDVKVIIEDKIVKTIKLSVLKDTDLYIDFNNTREEKLEFIIDVSDDVLVNIYEYKLGTKGKYSYNYNLKGNSKLNIYKLNDITETVEMLVFNLNGDGAKLNYMLKTIGVSDEKYDIMVYHNYSNTESTINNHGVNINDGNIRFNVSGFVPNGVKGCILNQNGRIINLTNNRCQINPNLFIDEHDVVANHSAHIGKCNADEIFYLMSRGLTYDEAENLLIKGFLIAGFDKLKEKCEDIIKKYWR